MDDSPSRWSARSPGDLDRELAEVHAGLVEPTVAAAVRASRDWARTPLATRVACLREAQTRLRSYQDALAEGITVETGKPITEARGEMGAVISKFDLTIQDAEQFVPQQPVEDNLQPAWIRHRPRGPAAVVGPFNFPLHLPNGALLSYLAAGNTVVFKPSPFAGNVAREYSNLLARAFPSGVFNLLQGWGNVSERLCLHPAIRSVCFTGSLAVGRKLASALSTDIGKDLALELGGKNAVIICPDADLDLAAHGVASGAYMTAGQRCNATSRVLVHEKVLSDFIARFTAAAAGFVPGDPLRPATRMGPLINARAVERYTSGLKEHKGSWVIEGGEVDYADGKRGFFVHPSAVLYKSRRDRVLALQLPSSNKEMFAPFVEIFAVNDLDDAVALHNSTPFGLTVSVFTRSETSFWELADQLRAGNIYGNLPTTQSPSTLPFGGLGDSGNRRPGGRGFIRFATDEQAVQYEKNGFV
jgi:acyl-CoA reductase-like NAD-dependent aldehyde dehydrogenase